MVIEFVNYGGPSIHQSRENAVPIKECLGETEAPRNSCIHSFIYLKYRKEGLKQVYALPQQAFIPYNINLASTVIKIHFAYLLYNSYPTHLKRFISNTPQEKFLKQDSAINDRIIHAEFPEFECDSPFKQSLLVNSQQ